MKKYVIGWDGGGTKTDIQIRDTDSNILFEYTGTPLNYNSQTKEEMANSVSLLVDKMREQENNFGSINENCLCMCISTAGVSNTDSVDFIKSILSKKNVNCPIKIVGDQESALFGAVGQSTGVVIVSGTGSVCYGKNSAGKTMRTGGWGHIIDDMGSGYYIGRNILSKAVQSMDSRIEHTVLEDLVLDEINGNTVNDIIKFTYTDSTNKKKIANLSKLLLQGLAENDRESISIAEDSAKSLFDMAVTVIEHLGLADNKIAITGGIFKYNDYISNLFKKLITEKYPKIDFMYAKDSNVSGACMIALQETETNK